MKCGVRSPSDDNNQCCFFEDVSVKSENMKSEVVITKEMEEEEKQLMEEGERKEKEMMEKVCCSLMLYVGLNAGSCLGLGIELSTVLSINVNSPKQQMSRFMILLTYSLMK